MVLTDGFKWVNLLRMSGKQGIFPYRNCTPFLFCSPEGSQKLSKVFDSLRRVSQTLLSPQAKRNRFFAGRQGIEPRLKASKASVLPLDDLPILTKI